MRDWVARLALGTVQFGLDYGVSNQLGKTAHLEVERVLNVAKTSGITCLDTAPVYGGSERLLGQLGVDAFDVVTKVPALGSEGYREQAARVAFRQSLTNLRRTQVYALIAHSAADLLGRSGPALYDEMRTIAQDGLAEKIGASVYTPDELDALLGQYELDLVQLPMNVLDQRFLRAGDLDELKSRGVEIHVRSVFLQGLLLMPIERLPVYFGPWLRQLRALNEAWHESELTPHQFALQFVLGCDHVDRVVVGVDNAGQLAEIVGAAAAASQSKTDVSPDYGALAVNDVALVDPSSWML